MRLEPGLGVRRRPGKMDKRGYAAFVTKGEDLAGARPAEDGEEEFGRHSEGAVRLHGS
jgi:hypothetical protein